MNISLLQTDIKWADPVFNRSHIEKLLEKLPKTDLVVLPEMFTTGFCNSPKELAEQTNSTTLLWMQEMAKCKDCAITGSIAINADGEYYNRLYFVMPDGSHYFYDKRHLFTYGGEHKQYIAGKNKLIVEYKGFRILLLICYDLRFPVFSRNKGDYDLVVYVANWPIARIHVWDILLKARAIENQSYVAGVNRVGQDPSSNYCGASSIVDFFGNEIGRDETSKECFISAELDLEKLNKFRQKFPFLNDADSFDLIG